MTAQEVFQEITSKGKWYAGYTSAQNATKIKRGFNNGTIRFKTLERLFNNFGYYIVNDSPWEKMG